MQVILSGPRNPWNIKTFPAQIVAVSKSVPTVTVLFMSIQAFEILSHAIRHKIMHFRGLENYIKLYINRKQLFSSSSH